MSVGNWSVSQPMRGSPVLASSEPRAPEPIATSISCIISWPARVAWFVSRLSLKWGKQPVGPEEVEAGGGVGVVLVLGRLLGLGLDVERLVEADLLLVVDRHVEEPAEVVDLALDVGVPEGRIPFATPPEGVAAAAEVDGHFHHLLDLRRGVGEGVEVGAGGRAVGVSGVGEEVRGAPEQLDAGPAHLVLDDLDDLVEVGVALLEGRAFGRHVAVVEGEEGHAQLLEELERRLDPDPGPFHPVDAVVPGPDGGAGAEGIAQRVGHRVPVDHREPEVVLHGLVADHLVGVVMLEFQRIPRLRPAKLDLGDTVEIVGHRTTTPLKKLPRLDWEVGRVLSLGAPGPSGNPPVEARTWLLDPARDSASMGRS